MTRLHRQRIVPYSAQQMYDLVNDIECYPQFLPWCGAATILEQSDEEMLAKLTVTAKGISKSFSTRNTLVSPQQIVMKLVDGPFKRFRSNWHFNQLDDGRCQITLDISFEFSSHIMTLLFGKIFTLAAQKMVESFSQRADSCYGKEGCHQND